MKKRRRSGILAAFIAAAGLCGAPAQAAPVAPYSPQRLEQLMDKVKTADKACPGGCGLEAAMNRYNIHPSLVTSKQMDIFAPGYGAAIAGRQQGNNMYLNGGYNDAKLIETVAHEVRHAWQKRELGAVSAQLDPRRALILNRFREADAFAFGIYFTYRVEQATGKTLVKVPADPRRYKDMHPYYQIYAMFKLNMDSGMPLSASYRYLVQDCFEHVNRVDYDGDLLQELEERAKKMTPGQQHTMPEATFTQILRRMGTPGFEGGYGAFEAWSDADLRDLHKSGGISADNLARLVKLEAAPPTSAPPAPPQAPGR
ncbi:MAG: hypothetical protein EPN97_04020 [Alphaproteobacteria bacterium]|nr:MAG: hypothetical protein EPN97_04020 [Alphaproteobacteria bacterium]